MNYFKTQIYKKIRFGSDFLEKKTGRNFPARFIHMSRI